MSTIKSANFDFVQEFNEILERIQLFSPEINKGDSDIARALNVSRTTPSTWRKRGKLPLEAIIEYAKKQGINIHWLLTGEGEQGITHLSTTSEKQYNDNAHSIYLNDNDAHKRVQERAKPKLIEFREVLATLDKKLTIPKNEQYETIRTILFKLATQSECDKEEYNSFIDYFNNPEFAMIPGYNIQVSAGHGAINNEEQPTRYLAFRHRWLKYRGFNEKDLVVVFAKGDSMEPTISNNNSLLIYTKIETIHDGSIYVIRQDDTLLVKRVQRLLDGNLKLISDNSAYEPMLLTKNSFESLDVVGQVVWIAKDVG